LNSDVNKTKILEAKTKITRLSRRSGGRAIRVAGQPVCRRLGRRAQQAARLCVCGGADKIVSQSVGASEKKQSERELHSAL